MDKQESQKKKGTSTKQQQQKITVCTPQSSVTVVRACSQERAVALKTQTSKQNCKHIVANTIQRKINILTKQSLHFQSMI
jgi:hypothetical protein